MLKLLNFKDKEKILAKEQLLKGTGIFINEDFAKETREKRQKLWEEVKRHRSQGKYTVIKYDNVYVREHHNMVRGALYLTIFNVTFSWLVSIEC